jgi:DNA helicase II / ATP-dependent DNA helicase PcrA
MEKEKMAMIAKYPGWCVKCKGRILAGKDYIERDENLGKFVHSHCPERNKYGAQVRNSTDSVALMKAAVSSAPVDNGTNASAIPTATVVGVPVKEFHPSKYQKAVFEFITKGEGNAVVEAVAGSGKTTTIVKALDLTSTDSAVAFLAFNKHIADELRRRAPAHVIVSTLHALGYKEINRYAGKRVDVDEDKLSPELDKYWPIDRKVPIADRLANRASRNIMRHLVSLAKAILLDTGDPLSIAEACERYGIDMMGGDQQFMALLPVFMDKSKEDTTVVDFDDMIWLPLILNLELTKFDWVFIDEAQDMNASQIELIKRIVKPGTGRIIAVGDRKQSLYGFRGADTDAIPRLIRELDATILPLSISYRCPVSHVAAAKMIVPQLESAPHAKEGKIEHITEKAFEEMLAPGDMVMCRTNAPLVGPAFRVIRRGIKACIRGRDIGAALVNMIDKFQTESRSNFHILLEEYFQKESERLLRNHKEMQVMALTDKVETLMLISDDCVTDEVQELRDKLLAIFSDEITAVVFSSVHRAKGLEANRTFILRPDLMPHPRAEQDWEKEQETNVMYVAMTRSKDELYYVDKEC